MNRRIDRNAGRAPLRLKSAGAWLVALIVLQVPLLPASLSTAMGADGVAAGPSGFSPPNIIWAPGRPIVSVAAGDIDGDGDADVVASNDGGTPQLAWFENLDGAGTFGPPIPISTLTNQRPKVVLADIDGDGDLDVLSASREDNTIAWFENTDGFGTFGPRRIISDTVDLPSAVIAADVDGDGDLDAVSASRGDNTFAWYENTDGLGNFGPQRVITAQFDGAYTLYAADLDGDGDLDLLTGSGTGYTIAWFENTDSLGTFGPERVIFAYPFDIGAGVARVLAADLDNDGYQDAVASVSPTRIVWFRNTNGTGSFSGEKIIAAASDPREIHLTDVDRDGDIDIVAALYQTGSVEWFQNVNHAASFNPMPIDNTLVRPARVYAADLDGDGDEDILTGNVGDTPKVVWFQNNVPDCSDSSAPDCNNNGVADFCDISQGTDPDCNNNGIPDSCDIADGTSLDTEGNGVPDECCTSAPTFVSPLKSRYISLESIGVPGTLAAVRITPTSLPGFEAFEGRSVWVGPPDTYPDEDASQPGKTFRAAGLQCEPYYRDWSTIDVLHVFGGEIVPRATYEVQVINEVCDVDSFTSFSAPLTATTGAWGDVVAPYYSVQYYYEPDFTDISVEVDKFLAMPSAPSKARAQCVPNRIFPSRPIDFNDISAAADAFLGVLYESKYPGPCTCPSAGACPIAS